MVSIYLLFWFPLCCCRLTPSTTHPVSCPPLEVGWTGGLAAGGADDDELDEPRLRTVSPLKRRLSSAAARFVKLTSAVIARHDSTLMGSHQRSSACTGLVRSNDVFQEERRIFTGDVTARATAPFHTLEHAVDFSQEAGMEQNRISHNNS